MRADKLRERAALRRIAEMPDCVAASSVAREALTESVDVEELPLSEGAALRLMARLPRRDANVVRRLLNEARYYLARIQ